MLISITRPSRSVSMVATAGGENAERRGDRVPVRCLGRQLHTASRQFFNAPIRGYYGPRREKSLVEPMAENPKFEIFGTARIAMPPRQIVVYANGAVYAITLSGLTVAPIPFCCSKPRPDKSRRATHQCSRGPQRPAGAFAVRRAAERPDHADGAEAVAPIRNDHLFKESSEARSSVRASSTFRADRRAAS